MEMEGEIPDFREWELSSKPNEFFVAPPGFETRSPPSEVAPVFVDLELDDFFDIVENVILADSRISCVISKKVNHRMKFVQRSRVFRFPDIILVEVVRLAEMRVSLAMLSHSRFGHYDFGVNERRVRKFLREIEAVVESRKRGTG